MSAGFRYDMSASKVEEEICDVQTLHRKRGAYKLETEGLPIGMMLPRFTPVRADLAKRTCVVVKNVKVVEVATAEATEIKIAKNSLVEVGQILGTGAKGAKVTAVNKSNSAYDVVTLETAFGAKIAEGTILFEASAEGGTTPKNTANFVIYEHTKIESGIVLVALTMQAFEIQSEKLVLPFTERDKTSLTARFQFD